MITPAEYHQLIHTHMTEKEWQQQVVSLAKSLGYTCYHTYNSKRCEPGYPDLSLMRAVPARFLMLELKTERGRLTHTQKQWIAGLKSAGIEVHVLKPSQFDELVEILKR